MSGRQLAEKLLASSQELKLLRKLREVFSGKISTCAYKEGTSDENP